MNAEAGKTIARVVDRDLCHGCGTCIASCPLGAITLTRDDRRGIYVPKIDDAICNQCGICLEVCPGHAVDFDQLNTNIFSERPKNYLLGVYRDGYAGYATDRNLRYKGASGGIVTGLLVSMLEEGLIDGALVTGMKKDNPLEPEPYIARTREDIMAAAKSKYCPVPANIALREIIDREGKYAVVGLPCHIHGIRKFERINKKLADRIVLHVGIFCGYNYSFLATDYLLSGKGVNKEDVAAITYRGEGWPGGVDISLSSGSRIFMPAFEMYNAVEYTFAPRRCLLCGDGAAELADISCGDAWLPEFSDDKEGVSIIITRTPQGEAMLKRTVERGLIEIKGVSAGAVMASQPDFVNKKVHIRLYFRVARILGQGIPSYSIKPGKMSFTSFLNASIRISGQILAPRRYLWRFIPVLHWLSRKVSSSVPSMTT